MNILPLDFETYFDNDYTLSKMTTEEYVRDERFEVHGFSIDWSKYPDAQCDETIWYDGEMAQPGPQCVLNGIDWDNIAVVMHHAHFDGLILSHHYGYQPKLFLDTLPMARLLFGNHIKKSLEALAELFGLGAKNVPYDLFKGKHWHELSPYVQKQVGDGCNQDVKLTWDLFQKLATSFPSNEYAFVDATVRMFTNPVLEGDTDLLAKIWEEEAATKAALLDKLGVTAKDLRQNWKFAELLRAEDIEPEQKAGKPAQCKDCKGSGTHADPDNLDNLVVCEPCDGAGTIERYNYSFAKTDDFMRDLVDDETPLAVMPEATVAMLAQAKLDAHSNGTQTRVQRMGWMSTRGDLCVYLQYAGTHLAGWSGSDKMNWQNFKRGGPIAKAIRARKGFAVVMADASQVECRLLNKVARQEDVVERFRQHQDPYVSLASIFYDEPIYKPKAGDPRYEEMEQKRGTGKQGELSCGYGAGDHTIQVTAKKGTYGPPVHLTIEEARRLKTTYRNSHPYVEHLWTEAGDVLKKLHAGMEFDWNVVHIQDKMMWLPNDVPLRYDTIEWHVDEKIEKKGWRVRNRKGWSWLYGSKFVENLIQALRNVLIRQAWDECMQAGINMVSMEHDKLIAVVAEHEAEAAFKFMRDAMSRPPAWMPDIPLDSEGYISDTFARPEK